MASVIKIEIYKQLRRKSYWVLLLINAAVSPILVLLMNFGGTFSAKSGYSCFVQGVSDISLPIILGAIFAAFYFGTDFSERTLNWVISSGISRFKFLLAKYIVYIISLYFIAVMAPLAWLITGSIQFGFGESVNIFYFLRAFVMYFFVISATGSFYALVSYIFLETSVIIYSSLAWMLIFSIIKNIASHNDIIKQLIYLLPSSLSPYIADKNTSAGTMFEVCGISLTALAVYFAITYLFFRKRELK